MKWLTIEEVKKYATTPRKALEISIKHWWQNATATEKELRAYVREDGRYAPIRWRLCGLCKYHHLDCDVCPLKYCYNKSEYDQAVKVLEVWYNNETPETFKEWKQAARAMHKKLCSLRS